MKIIKSIKSYLSRFSRKKEVKKLPKVKQVKSSTVNVVAYGLLIVFFSVGLFGLLRSIGMSTQVDSLKAQVKKLDSTIVDIPNKQQTLDVSKVRQYMAGFIRTYINYTSEGSATRLKDLENYYSFNTNSYRDELKAPRTLLSQGLIAIEEYVDYKVAKVKVQYESGEGENKVTEISVLAIPFKMNDGLLAIVSTPYFVQEDDLLGKSKAFEILNSNDIEKLDEKTVKSLKDFLPIFFEKYALSEEKDLSLLMKKPAFMGGKYKVQTVNDSSAVFYKTEGKTAVQVSVDFENISTGAVHTERFTLYLSKQSSGWYVDEFYQYYKN